jgi:hypothetical protein
MACGVRDIVSFASGIEARWWRRARGSVHESAGWRASSNRLLGRRSLPRRFLVVTVLQT